MAQEEEDRGSYEPDKKEEEVRTRTTWIKHKGIVLRGLFIHRPRNERGIK